MEKLLKYKWLLERENLTDCPFSDCIERSIEAFRWTFQDIADPRNFVPKLLSDEQNNIPKRRNSASDDYTCSACGLSMFDSEDAARKKFTGYPQRTRALLGYSHIAGGKLEKSLGLTGQPNAEGHFDLFEYEKVDLSTVFSIIGPI